MEPTNRMRLTHLMLVFAAALALGCTSATLSPALAATAYSTQLPV